MQMLTILVLVGIAYATPDVLQSALRSPQQLARLYSDYESSFGKKYDGAEARMRLGLFRKTVRAVVSHNSKDSGYKAGINQFADLTAEEKMSYTGLNLSMIETDVPMLTLPLNGKPTAGSSDWTGRAVTKIKNQGRCGSCWVFSATGAIEGQYKVLGGVLKSFSEQEGLSCAARNGCNGGWMGNLYDYVAKVGRYAPMKDAPYEGMAGRCSYYSVPNGLISQKVNSWKMVKGDSNVAQVISSYGPVSVGYMVVDSFFKYTSGIYTESNCRGGGGHAVVATGYTSSYFKIKNSWGISFGEKGYFRIGRGNVCGITNTGTLPTMKSTGQRDTGRDESTDESDDGGDNGNNCPSGFKECPGGRCVHEHWHC